MFARAFFTFILTLPILAIASVLPHISRASKECHNGELQCCLVIDYGGFGCMFLSQHLNYRQLGDWQFFFSSPMLAYQHWGLLWRQPSLLHQPIPCKCNLDHCGTLVWTTLGRMRPIGLTAAPAPNRQPIGTSHVDEDSGRIYLNSSKYLGWCAQDLWNEVERKEIMKIVATNKEETCKGRNWSLIKCRCHGIRSKPEVRDTEMSRNTCRYTMQWEVLNMRTDEHFRACRGII